MAKQMGIPRPRKIISFDETFFSTIHTIGSYIAGFIAADGCIVDRSYTKGQSQIVIQSGSRDANHLYSIGDALCFMNKYTIIPKGIVTLPGGKRGRHNGSVRMVLTSDVAAADLEKNYNVIPRKSLILKPPRDLDFDNKIAFAAGVIDGDGSVCPLRDKRQNRTHPFQLMCCGTKEVVTWIRNVIYDSTHGIGKRPVVLAYGNIHRFVMKGRRIVEFKKHLMDLQLPVMERKWGIVRDYMW